MKLNTGTKQASPNNRIKKRVLKIVPISNDVIIEALRNILISLIHKNIISEINNIISLNISKGSKNMPNDV